jgi:hypothetical protein
MSAPQLCCRLATRWLIGSETSIESGECVTPLATFAALRQLSAGQGRPMWRVVVDSIDAYAAAQQAP